MSILFDDQPLSILKSDDVMQTSKIEKHQLFRLIIPKQVKIDMPCRNEKSLNLGAFSDTSVSFSH